MSSIRENKEEIERKTLAPGAALSCNSKGRLKDEEECTIRTAYQRDRDRIIHSSSFRRLKHKTQVFLSPEGDYYRTRLTHTLEVMQIADTIAGALGLNRDLTQAISLGHDLGHTPFGHAGERVLASIVPGGFRHYEQSLRVVDSIEKEGSGLNLTFEVRDGIVRHTTGEQAKTLEGRVVRLADKIAYLNHDIDDAQTAKILTEDDIPLEIRDILGYSKTERIDTLVRDCIENSAQDITLSPQIAFAVDLLYEFMDENVYRNPVCKGEEAKAQEMIAMLYEHFRKNPLLMPELYIEISRKESPERGACDFVAGMTDRYAVKVFNDMFVPKAWTNY